MLTNKWDAIPKNTVFGPRNCIFSSKISFLLRYAQITLFFGFRQTWLNGTISFPCPEVTLDTFGFPVGAYSAVRQAVVWPQLPKITIFGPKMHIIPLYRIASYGTAWNWILSYGIALYLIVLHWYCMVLHGIAWYCIVPLLASARGLYLARHLSTLLLAPKELL